MTIFDGILLVSAVVFLAAVGWRAWRYPRAGVADPLAPTFSITIAADGVIVRDLRLQPVSDSHLLWSEVHRAVAYKRDLLAYDCICVFLARADDTGIELDEEMVGWEDFCEMLPRVLPGCTSVKEWHHKVALPAFATNQTELYAREAVHVI